MTNPQAVYGDLGLLLEVSCEHKQAKLHAAYAAYFQLLETCYQKHLEYAAGQGRLLAEREYGEIIEQVHRAYLLQTENIDRERAQARAAVKKREVKR
jgi:hypothetical protein